MSLAWSLLLSASIGLSVDVPQVRGRLALLLVDEGLDVHGDGPDAVRVERRGSTYVVVLANRRVEIDGTVPAVAELELAQRIALEARDRTNDARGPRLVHLEVRGRVPVAVRAEHAERVLTAGWGLAAAPARAARGRCLVAVAGRVEVRDGPPGAACEVAERSMPTPGPAPEGSASDGSARRGPSGVKSEGAPREPSEAPAASHGPAVGGRAASDVPEDGDSASPAPVTGAEERDVGSSTRPSASEGGGPGSTTPTRTPEGGGAGSTTPTRPPEGGGPGSIPRTPTPEGGDASSTGMEAPDSGDAASISRTQTPDGSDVASSIRPPAFDGEDAASTTRTPASDGDDVASTVRTPGPDGGDAAATTRTAAPDRGDAVTDPTTAAPGDVATPPDTPSALTDPLLTPAPSAWTLAAYAGATLRAHGTDPAVGVDAVYRPDWYGAQISALYVDGGRDPFRVFELIVAAGPAVRARLGASWSLGAALLLGARMHDYDVAPDDAGTRWDFAVDLPLDLTFTALEPVTIALVVRPGIDSRDRRHTDGDTVLWERSAPRLGAGLRLGLDFE